MSKTKIKPAATNRNKILMLSRLPTESEEQSIAAAAVSPAVNAVHVIDSYQRNIMGEDVNITALVDALRESANRANAGDLSTLEAMLIGQATALQAIFTSLAKRAVHQEMMVHYETFLRLALKAQSQSRATISALVDLKYPRQATFVKQANIANGPQQVNNGAPGEPSHARESQPVQNELLEGKANGSTYLDAGTKAAAARGSSAVETVAAVNRAKKR